MLRKLHAFYERLFGEDDSARLIPIPKDDPAIYVSEHQAESYHQTLQDCIELLKSEYKLHGDKRAGTNAVTNGDRYTQGQTRAGTVSGNSAADGVLFHARSANRYD